MDTILLLTIITCSTQSVVSELACFCLFTAHVACICNNHCILTGLTCRTGLEYSQLNINTMHGIAQDSSSGF